MVGECVRCSSGSAVLSRSPRNGTCPARMPCSPRSPIVPRADDDERSLTCSRSSSRRARPRTVRNAGRQDRCAAGQSRHPGCPRGFRGAPLSQGVSERSEGDREPGPIVEAPSQRRHPAHQAAAKGARLPQDLEPGEERIAAQDHHPLAGGKARASARALGHASRGRLGDALRPPFDRVAHRGPRRPRLRAPSGHPALSAVLRRYHRHRRRRGVSCPCRHAPPAVAAHCGALLQRSRLYRGGRVLDRRGAFPARFRARRHPCVVPRGAAGLSSTRAILTSPIASKPCGCCAPRSGSTNRS